MHPEIAAQPTIPTETFTIRLSSTRRGARLARLLAAQQLDTWGIPYSAAASRTVAGIVAELAANAVTHGHRPGRDFELRLLLRPGAVRVEVSDARPERPVPATPSAAGPDSPSGRGLLLVEAFATRWGWACRDAYVKTVWAEVDLDGPPGPARSGLVHRGTMPDGHAPGEGGEMQLRDQRV